MINYLIGSVPILYEPVGPCHKVVTKKGQFSKILENGESLMSRVERQASHVMTAVGNRKGSTRLIAETASCNHAVEMNEDFI